MVSPSGGAIDRRSFSDAAPGMFKRMLMYKAECHGSKVVSVDLAPSTCGNGATASVAQQILSAAMA